VYPPLHVNVHVPSMHAAVALATTVKHWLEHMPQLLTLITNPGR
jgi:hypothetical protein